MKRIMKGFIVFALCIAMAGGAVVPTINISGVSMESTVATVQAKQKINKKFKKAMDEYLKFYKKYCKFMKKYKKSNNTVSMLTDYTKLLAQQNKVNKAFKKWKKKNLNNAELTYYTKINSQVLVLLAKCS